MKLLMKLLKRDQAVEPSLFKVAEEQFARWSIDLQYEQMSSAKDRGVR